MLNESRNSCGCGGARAALYNATRKLTSRLPDSLWAAYQVGDTLQRGLVDIAFQMATLQFFRPQALLGWSSALAEQAYESSSLLPVFGQGRQPITELTNNYQVFQLVKNIGKLLDIPEGSFPLQELIGRAYSLGEF